MSKNKFKKGDVIKAVYNDDEPETLYGVYNGDKIKRRGFAMDISLTTRGLEVIGNENEGNFKHLKGV